MSNPTTPFGWQMPTNTDLVTDLPADFEVFGQAVATSMADLLGGTTGQILSKTSATDMDFTWTTPNPGDITGVTAGTGISGGGTSGDVTITNSMATEIAAKADLIVGTGAAAFDNLTVGANGTVLTADSTVSPTGLKWATPAGGGKVLQVVQGTYSTPLTIATTTFTDTGLTLAITPTLATSKVLVLVVQNIYAERASSGNGCALQLLRGASVVHAQAAASQSLYMSAAGVASMEIMGMIPLNYLDSPATTSSTNYKIQARANTTANAGSITANNAICTITLLEIGA